MCSSTEGFSGAGTTGRLSWTKRDEDGLGFAGAAVLAAFAALIPHAEDG